MTHFIRVITAISVCVLTLVAACDNSHSDQTVPPTEASTTIARIAATSDWSYIYTQYNKLFTRFNICGSDGVVTGACNQLRHVDLKNLQVDAMRLAPSEDLTWFLRTINNWLTEYDRYDDNMCLGTANTGQLACTLSENLLDTDIATLAAIAKKNAGA